MNKNDLKREKRKVFNYIDEHKAEIIQFLTEYIKIKSVNPNELEVQEWLKERFEEMGFDNVDYWAVDEKGVRPNVVATVKGKGNGRSLILNGHSDTVPVHEEQLKVWSIDPWAPIIKDDMIYGRGAVDMKGGNTAMIWAAKAIMDSEIELNGDIYIECVSGEESNEGGTIGTNATIERGYKAPFAIVHEPTNCEIHTITPGVFLFELMIRGKGIHVSSRNLVIFPQKYGIPSGPEVGVDAIAKALPFIEMFQRLEVQFNHRWRHEILGGGGYPLRNDSQGTGIFTINLSLIEGGTYLGAVPDYCKMIYCVWHPFWVKAEDVWNELEAHVKALASTDDWLRENPPIFKAPVLQKWDPAYTPLNNEGVQGLMQAFKEVVEEDAIISGFKAVCDATYFVKKGIPAAIFGPGDLRMGAHGPDEHVPIEDILKVAKVDAAFAINWCSS